MHFTAVPQVPAQPFNETVMLVNAVTSMATYKHDLCMHIVNNEVYIECHPLLKGECIHRLRVLTVQAGMVTATTCMYIYVITW